MCDPYAVIDTTSLSNSEDAVSTHIHLDWVVDFTTTTIRGTATHSVRVLKDGVTCVSFDSSELSISAGFVDGKTVDVKTDAPHAALGTRVSVPIPSALQKKGSELEVSFAYTTSPNASAIQWADAAATADKRHPYVYTQCQAIHARSLLPCQDSPGVKTTYTAHVEAPHWCTVLMSAVAVNVERSVDKSVHKWDQKVPTSAYLIALAGGELVSRDLSPRVRIWSEPSVVDLAAFDFSQTEDFVAAAEAITGCDYQWGRYDVLCMPPSFPYGGMENPCLTFVTPTLLTGDKSLADVIAHEIAHSWTGNLVTNKTWNHFFLNEGWTMWLQRKIEQRVKGGVEHLKLSAQAGVSHLRDDIALFGDSNPLTCLVCPLGDQDPDDSFSSVPYEKGFSLLYYLETMVGTSNFEKFAKAYIQHFKFKTVTSGAFKDLFLEFCRTPTTLTDKQKKAVGAIDWDTIFHAPGMPPYTHDFTNTLSADSAALGKKWINASNSDNFKCDFAAADIETWSTQQRLIFLDTLLEHFDKRKEPPSKLFLTELDKAYGLTPVKNAEIRFKWQSLCIRGEYKMILPHVKEFLVKQGRMKFVRPLYRQLASSKMGAEQAEELFERKSGLYHPIARKMIRSDLDKIKAKKTKSGYATAVCIGFNVAFLLLSLL